MEGPSDHTGGGPYIHAGYNMIPVPYKVRENHQIPILYKVWGTIEVFDNILAMCGDYMIPIPYRVLGTIRVT